jgi:hypothetical protein
MSIKGAFTNIEEVEREVNRHFKGMMKSKEMTDAGKTASKVMGRYVLDEVADGGESGYDYEQSGDFHNMLSSEAKGGDIQQTPSKLSMGFGYIPELNNGVEAKRNFQTQKHWIGSRKNGRYVTVQLKEEKQMPKWIIAEFGSGKQAEKGKRHKDMQISYSPRPDKKYMFGPSKGKVGGDGGGSKEGYFMISKQGAQGMYGNKSSVGRKHPGVKAGRIFRRGLEKSKEEVREILGDGIRSYLNNN